MVKDLKEAMRHLLESATWMDDLTAKAAFRKLSSMENLVAYSELLSKNVSAIDEEYHDVHSASIAIAMSSTDDVVGTFLDKNREELFFNSSRNR